MKNRRHQRVIMAAGLCFSVLSSLSFADEAQIRAKSKALAHYTMGVIEDLNGNNQKALWEYEKSAKFDRDQPMTHLRLGSYYAKLNRFDDAARQLKIVIKLKPEASQAHYLLALIYSSQKKLDIAAHEYELVLKTPSDEESDDVEIHSYLAQLYFAMHKYPQCQEQIAKILQFQPKNVSVILLEGSIYLELKETEKAKEDFRKILALEPDHEEALNSLAYTSALEGANLDEALKMIRKAIDLDPSNGAYYDTLGWVLFKQGLNAESLMALEKAQTYMTDPLIYEHIGDVYKAQNDPTHARKFWLKSLALDPKQPEVSKKLEELNRTSASNQNTKHPSAK